MNLFDLTDESLIAFYESVRRQVAADEKLGGRYRLVGSNMKQYADRLKDEMTRRRLPFTPIDWSS
jgi:hypothetical protein